MNLEAHGPDLDTIDRSVGVLELQSCSEHGRISLRSKSSRSQLSDVERCLM